jgi:hypothetical protein
MRSAVLLLSLLLLSACSTPPGVTDQQTSSSSISSAQSSSEASSISSEADSSVAPAPVSWKTYENTSQKISFSYPSSYTILTDKVWTTYTGGNTWYRIELQDSSSPQRPFFILEVNADGYGPFFPDTVLTLGEDDAGNVLIAGEENGGESEYNDQKKVLLIAKPFESRNGNWYSTRFSFTQGAQDLSPVYMQILGSMRFADKAAGSASPAQEVLYRNAARRFTLRLPAGSMQRSGEEVFDLPFTPGTTLQEKFLTIATGENATVANCRQPGLMTEKREEVVVNGIRFTKETGGDHAMSQYWDSVRYETGYPNYSGSHCLAFTFTLHHVSQGPFDDPPPLFDAAKESAVFDAIMRTIAFD